MSGLPAQNLDAEMSVLGACLVKPEALDECAEIISAEAFYLPSNGLVFQAMLDVVEKCEPVDILTLAGRLDAQGKLKDIGGPEKERVREEFMQKARATKGF